jgi:hypothetical protein
MILFELFAFVTWQLLGAVIIAAFLIGGFLEDESPTAASVSFVIAAVIIGTVIFDWRSSLEVIAAIPQNIGLIACYLVAGLFWSIFKWGCFVRGLAKQLALNLAGVEKNFSAENLKKYIEDGLRDDKPFYTNATAESLEIDFKNNRMKQLAEAINCALHEVRINRISASQLENRDLTVGGIFDMLGLTAGGRKALITAWIVYWPISMLTTVIREFVINLISNIVDACQGIYNQIAKMVIGNALKGAVIQANENELTVLKK